MHVCVWVCMGVYVHEWACMMCSVDCKKPGCFPCSSKLLESQFLCCNVALAVTKSLFVLILWGSVLNEDVPIASGCCCYGCKY